MPELAEQLREFLSQSQDAPSDWTTTDCSRWPASWVASVHECDVPLPTWSSREEAHCLIEEAGSLVRLWSEALFEFGLRECGAPDLGDVGVINTARFGQIGGIFVAGGYFACRAEAGVIYLMPRHIVKSWAIL